MLIREIMDVNATRISARATRQAAELVRLSQASDLMVVDDQNSFLGALSEGDLIRTILPRFDELMESGGSLTEAFRVFVDHGREFAEQSIDALVIKNPVVFKPGDDALKAAATMVAKQIRRLPVVYQGKLVGTVSRADVGRAALAHG